MIYLCIFAPDTKETEQFRQYLEGNGYTECLSCSDKERRYGNFRCKIVTPEEQKNLELKRHIIVSFQLKDGSNYMVQKPFGSSHMFTFDDIESYKYLKKFYQDEVVGVHIRGADKGEYINRLTDWEEEDYTDVADISLDNNLTLKEKIKEIEKFIGERRNENMFKMQNNNKKR